MAARNGHRCRVGTPRILLRLHGRMTPSGSATPYSAGKPGFIVSPYPPLGSITLGFHRCVRSRVPDGSRGHEQKRDAALGMLCNLQIPVEGFGKPSAVLPIRPVAPSDAIQN